MTGTASFIWENAVEAVWHFYRIARGDGGQTLAEYSLLLTLIAVGVITPTVILMRGALANAFDDATDCLSSVTC